MKKTPYIFFINTPKLIKTIIYAISKKEAIKAFNINTNKTFYNHVSKVDNIKNLLGRSHKLINLLTINQKGQYDKNTIKQASKKS